MTYDSPIPKSQGAAKISEVFTDRALDIIKTQIGESGIKVLEQLVRVSADALRRINYIMYSPGRINWTGTAIEFDSDSRDNDIVFRILQTEDGDPATPRHVDLTLQGVQTVNGETAFKSITLNDGEILYLELDRALVLAAGASKDVHNGVGGGSIFTGLTLKKTTVATGLPSLKSQEGVSPTDTFAIPLAMRVDWTDGIDSFQDIWWIPHGIRWPMETRSPLGGVVVLGLETWPSIFVGSQAQLIQAITDLTTTGGVILANQPFTLNTPVTIPNGVTLISRSNKYTTAEATITLTTGASITLASGAKMFNCNLEGNSGFSAGTDALVKMTGVKAEIRDCTFKLTNTPAGTPSCVTITGTANRIHNSSFTISSAAGNVGIKYSTGGSADNSDIDSQFL